MTETTSSASRLSKAQKLAIVFGLAAAGFFFVKIGNEQTPQENVTPQVKTTITQPVKDTVVLQPQ